MQTRWNLYNVKREHDVIATANTVASIAEKPRGGVDSAIAALKTKAGHLDWDKVEADWEATESARLEACRRIRAGEKGFSLLVANRGARKAPRKRLDMKLHVLTRSGEQRGCRRPS